MYPQSKKVNEKAICTRIEHNQSLPLPRISITKASPRAFILDVLIIKPRLSKPANSAPLNWLFVSKSSRECGRDCDFYYTHTRSHAIPSKPLYAWLWLYCATSFVSQLVGCNREHKKWLRAAHNLYYFIHKPSPRVRHTCKLFCVQSCSQPAFFAAAGMISISVAFYFYCAASARRWCDWRFSLVDADGNVIAHWWP